MERCTFEATYNDLANHEKYTPWRCDELTNDLVCEFHEISKTWTATTIQRFREKVKTSIEWKKTLYCIGYYFPINISFSRIFSQSNQNGQIQRDTSKRVFDIAIYLCDSKFEGQVEFSYCKFKKPVSLAGANFMKQVLFRYADFDDIFYPRDTTFDSNVNFRGTKFFNADFHDTFFKDKANFRDSKFEGEYKIS